MVCLISAKGEVVRAIITLAAVFNVFSAAALAADLPVKTPPPPASYSWTGLYAGVGFGFQVGTITGPAVAGFDLNLQPTLWGAGVSLGYRYELPNRFVLVLDASAPVWSSKTTFTAPVGTLSFHPRYAIMPEAQIGYAMGKFLPFVGFGVGYTNTRVGATPTGGKTAWASGDSPLILATCGIDYSIVEYVVLGLRYDHIEVQEGNWNFTGATPPFGPKAGGYSDGLTATLQYQF
jgi:opacity protein-like surface antigen